LTPSIDASREALPLPLPPLLTGTGQKQNPGQRRKQQVQLRRTNWNQQHETGEHCGGAPEPVNGAAGRPDRDQSDDRRRAPRQQVDQLVHGT
jgi:hypothetical protein